MSLQMPGPVVVNKTLLAELEKEKDEIGDAHPHAAKLLSEEIDRVQKGVVDKYKAIHHDRPIKIAEKILIPVKEFPKFNFAGKLLGPKGSSLKKLQEDTGTKMSILGRGVIRDKNKEEEMRKQGGPKFSHLNEEQHVLVEIFAHPVEAYQRLATAVNELRRYLVPDYNDEIGVAQRQEMGLPPVGPGQGSQNGSRPPMGGGVVGGGGGGGGGGLQRGRGGMRGGTRGGMMGGAPARGAPRGRGGPPSAPRAHAPVRHQAPTALKYEQDYSGGYGGQQGYDYGNQGYEASGYDQSGQGSYDFQDQNTYAEPASSYDQGYDSHTAASDNQYYDYGSGGQDQGYGDSWSGQQSSYGKAPAARGRGGVADYRSRPYAPPSRGGRY